MGTPTDIVIAATALAACIVLGGGIYETVVVDPRWPRRPGIIQERNGGIVRRRFWIPAHAAFEVLLVASLILSFGDAPVRNAVLVALVSHAVMRIWSFLDFIPKALEFERTDPADVDVQAAVAWTRRSRWRLPLDAIACVALLTALALA
ncbi:hypothetical protein C731_3601 [Mycolicibacterium hassiacum DSM 44199]|jgi:hypothetical protein|uniref:Uncharacterized protein n=1 Tax=Mycolicibacterium hassiacum (strain DSM 44199 / CIP 105218 / JCM 12690 / 3849) TaxID=1122247 RepID=K5BJ36_MYCHD|nr:hypothetical protein [Mycolicibacterium hassiacum]EKF22429.1 hypothetical protein C731_3601 [Mycolicibacterium hassiacum DSM 44199]MBX5487141.1 hypothetical protein [Mycolicibacterium hassiacum]MDA4084927.1 hypothetical protein [Mycolicibacterium hassiacum DSM 44199]PZN23265.1 MAG: hypothetical protein DIU75_05805 [Mycolicibacterium hassiacum]VCT91755.1 hypothetical protein MHAS_03474 [Mycolicibacterium hassiacum DSM 44199]